MILSHQIHILLLVQSAMLIKGLYSYTTTNKICLCWQTYLVEYMYKIKGVD